ncbi:MAG: glycosyltransferase [Thermotogota bacterium]|nr:glycosyltransferase [Thermotogota bacterium]
MSSRPLVSIIIPTLNSEGTVDACLESIKNQSYGNVEVVVVDGFSGDGTGEIAERYGAEVIESDAKRSRARNIGVKESEGHFILSLDSDMELAEKVVEECVDTFQSDKNAGGVIIPEKSVGDGFWVKVRDFERSFYAGTEIESARFFKKEMVERVDGFDEDVVFFEESTLPQKIEKLGYNVKLRTDSYILHHEDNFNLMNWLKKKHAYAKTASVYSNEYKNYASKQVSILYRYSLFLKNGNWKKFLSKPLLALGVLVLKSLEFLAGGLGYLRGKVRE